MVCFFFSGCLFSLDDSACTHTRNRSNRLTTVPATATAPTARHVGPLAAELRGCEPCVCFFPPDGFGFDHAGGSGGYTSGWREVAEARGTEAMECEEGGRVVVDEQ